jgi:hypothetical protein
MFSGAVGPDPAHADSRKMLTTRLSGIQQRLIQLWDAQDVIGSLWRIVAAPSLTAALVVVGVLGLALGLAIPQIPATALADPAVGDMWLNALRQRYPAFVPWLIWLGLVDLRHAWWLRSAYGLLALNLSLRLVSLVWPSQALNEQHPSLTLVHPDPELEAEALCLGAAHTLRKLGFRVKASEHALLCFADRFSLPSVLVLAGLLLASLGLIVSERTAWWERGIVLRPDQTRPLGHDTGLAVTGRVLGVADSVTAEPEEPAAELTLLRTGRVAGTMRLDGTWPAVREYLVFSLSSVEPAMLVKAQDARGNSLGLQTPETGSTEYRELSLRFGEDDTPRYLVTLDPSGARQYEQRGNERYVIVPSRELTLHLVYHPGGGLQAMASYSLEAFREGQATPIERTSIESAILIKIDGCHFIFEPRYEAVIDYGRDLGWVLAAIGGMLALAGAPLSLRQRAQSATLHAYRRGDAASLRLTAVSSGGHLAPEWLDDIAEKLAAALHLTRESSPAGTTAKE